MEKMGRISQRISSVSFRVWSCRSFLFWRRFFNCARRAWDYCVCV